MGEIRQYITDIVLMSAPVIHHGSVNRLVKRKSCMVMLVLVSMHEYVNFGSNITRINR